MSARILAVTLPGLLLLAVARQPVAQARLSRPAPTLRELLKTAYRLPEPSPREAWFTRGMRQYYAFRTLRDVGELPESGFRAALEAAWDRYRRDSWIATGSIAQAGSRVREHGALVADGGMLIAACLEADIRVASKGQRGVDHLLLSVALRADEGESYDNAIIYYMVRELADDATARELSRWVEGSATLALWRCATETNAGTALPAPERAPGGAPRAGPADGRRGNPRVASRAAGISAGRGSSP